MTTDRDRFLATVRRAVAEGNRLSGAPPLPERFGTGYQGAGDDAVGKFTTELAGAGGTCHVVANRLEAAARVLEIVRSKSARQVLLGVGPVVDQLDLQGQLRQGGVEVAAPGAAREAQFAAEVGITGVDYLIAETGSIVLLTAPDRPRSFSLLPPVHIAVAERAQLLPDLFDLFERHDWLKTMPSCLTLITGPSKTGDIELRLVTGVHGPGEVHVVLIDNAAKA
jgi:L-lactate utilization protein LutC